MNAPAKELSRESLVAKRRELEGQLTGAQAKFNETSLKLHSGEITEEEAAKVAAEPELIRMRIRGVDAALQEHDRVQAEKARASERAAWKAAKKQARQLEANAEEAFTAIVEHLADVAPFVAAYNEVITDIENLHRAHRELLGREGTGEALRDLRDRDRERLKIDACIFEALGSFGMGNRQAWHDWASKDAAFVIAFKSRIVDALVEKLSQASEEESD